MSELAIRFQKADPAILWLLTGLVLVIAPHVMYQSPALIITAAILLIWRLTIELKLIKNPVGWLMTLFALAAFVAVSYENQTIFGRDAGVGLLIIMCCLKLMEMHSSRDFMISVFLGYFVVITGFLFSQTFIVGMLMTSAVFVLTTALVSYHRNNKSFNAQYKSARLALALLFQAIPLAIILFFLFPRINGPLWGLPDNGSIGRTGLSSSMTPGQITELAFDNSVAFRVKFENNEIPSSDKLYWRGPIFTYYDGYMWQDLASKSKKKNFEEQWVTEKSIRPEVNPESRTSYSVTLQANNKNWLLVLDIPTFPPKFSYFTDNYELLSEQPIKTVKNYNVVSYTDYKLQADKIPNNRVYTQVPQFIGVKARKLVTELQEKIEKDKVYDVQMVNSVLDYIRDNPFYYTRTPPAMLERPVDKFLFDEQRGFCEHYASAFVTLMRIAGIPSRIVTGYLGGEVNEFGDYLIVRQSDAHAWTEVWLEKKGWVRIDPTAVIPPERVIQPEYRNRLRQSSSGTSTGSKINWLSWIGKSLKNVKHLWDNVNHNWNHWVIGYNSGTQYSFFEKIGFQYYTATTVFTIMTGIVAAILIAIAIFLNSRNQTRYSTAQRVFNRFCKKLARKGFKHQPAETALNYADRIAATRKDLAREVSDIALLYNQIRYSKNASEQEIQELEKQVNNFKP